MFSFTRIKPGHWAWVQGSRNKALGPFTQMLGTERRAQCQGGKAPSPKLEASQPSGCGGSGLLGPDRTPAGHSKPTPARPSPAHPSLPGPAPPWATCSPGRGLLPQAHHPWVHVPSPPRSLAFSASACPGLVTRAAGPPQQPTREQGGGGPGLWSPLPRPFRSRDD